MGAQMWAERMKAPTLMMWLNEDEEIDRGLSENVFFALGRLESKPEVLWVMLNSRGGDLSAAYQITRRLQAAAKRVHVVIPRMAKSAATLIALGCHEVVMHPMAELGPIDTQISVVRNGAQAQRSTLDGLKSLEYLREYGIETFARTVWLLRDMGLTTQVASKLADDVMSAITGPIFGKIDPVQMGEVYRRLDTSREYARRLLAHSYDEMPVPQRTRLLKKFVEGYPAHGFIIDVDEAKELGLRAAEANGAQRQVLDFSVAFSGSGRLVDLVSWPSPGTAADSGGTVPADGRASAKP